MLVGEWVLLRAGVVENAPDLLGEIVATLSKGNWCQVLVRGDFGGEYVVRLKCRGMYKFVVKFADFQPLLLANQDLPRK